MCGSRSQPFTFLSVSRHPAKYRQVTADLTVLNIHSTPPETKEVYAFGNGNEDTHNEITLSLMPTQQFSNACSARICALKQQKLWIHVVHIEHVHAWSPGWSMHMVAMPTLPIVCHSDEGFGYLLLPQWDNQTKIGTDKRPSPEYEPQ